MAQFDCCPTQRDIREFYGVTLEEMPFGKHVVKCQIHIMQLKDNGETVTTVYQAFNHKSYKNLHEFVWRTSQFDHRSLVLRHGIPKQMMWKRFSLDVECSKA